AQEFDVKLHVSHADSEQRVALARGELEGLLHPVALLNETGEAYAFLAGHAGGVGLRETEQFVRSRREYRINGGRGVTAWRRQQGSRRRVGWRVMERGRGGRHRGGLDGRHR